MHFDKRSYETLVSTLSKYGSSESRVRDRFGAGPYRLIPLRHHLHNHGSLLYRTQHVFFSRFTLFDLHSVDV